MGRAVSVPPRQPAALVMGLIWVVDDAGIRQAHRVDWVQWTAFVVTLYAGLTMVTNAPFYSFKVLGGRRSVPFIVLVVVMFVIAVVGLRDWSRRLRDTERAPGRDAERTAP